MSKAPNFIAKLAAIKEGINGYSLIATVRKAEMHTTGKLFLKALAKDLGWAKDDYEVRSSKAGVGVSGEVTLHGNALYVQVSEYQFFGEPGVSVLYRSCSGRKDYSGHQNHITSMKRLAMNGAESYEAFLSECKTLIERAQAKC